MRIVTRPDFDGIVCAVLLLEAENINQPVEWMEPNQIQSKKALIKKGDILANLPYDSRCSMWFDHHVSNVSDKNINGAFEIAPSAAGVVYKYYKEKDRISKNYDELVLNTDIIDAAKLSEDQVLYPEKYPYIILSMTIKNQDETDLLYWNKLIELLRYNTIDKVLEDPDVEKRCKETIEENNIFSSYLKDHTKIVQNISITDFRSLKKEPSGNRFLTYSLFPDTIASIKIRYKDSDKNSILLSVGHSIFKKECNVNVGKLLSTYGGGGHAGAGGCTLGTDTAQEQIDEIVSIMLKNQEN